VNALLKLNTAASSLPVTLAEAKAHLRVDDTTDDTLITAMLTGAVANAEHIMCRAIMPQKWEVTLDAFPCYVEARHCGEVPAYGRIELKRPKVTAVDSVKYYDADGVLTTISSSAYQLVSGDYSADVRPAYGEAWPCARWQAEAVQVIFSCGYANAAAVPEPIKAWIKLRVGAMYENRESTVVVVGGRLTLVELPFVDTLLDPYKTFTG